MAGSKLSQRHLFQNFLPMSLAQQILNKVILYDKHDGWTLMQSIFMVTIHMVYHTPTE